MMKSSECPVCGSSEIFTDWPLPEVNQEWRNRYYDEVEITRGRSARLEFYICGDCGYVHTYVNADKLDSLGRRWHRVGSKMRVIKRLSEAADALSDEAPTNTVTESIQAQQGDLEEPQPAKPRFTRRRAPVEPAFLIDEPVEINESAEEETLPAETTPLEGAEADEAVMDEPVYAEDEEASIEDDFIEEDFIEEEAPFVDEAAGVSDATMDPSDTEVSVTADFTREEPIPDDELVEMDDTIPADDAIEMEELAPEDKPKAQPVVIKPAPARLTDVQWEEVEELLAAYQVKRTKHDARDIVDAIVYKQVTGRSWKKLPDAFPPHRSVYRYYRRWCKSGAWSLIHGYLKVQLRFDLGDNPCETP
ncbi:transposase [Phototrophicus methaneseepsis]|uniref:Transposase n=1 Tax=Phototrophicus methaneseepsis TaxID=2710758 RepID=A0A7S8IEX7_9CHLR|nr:transposase [Phototrophicus methaneseepsis]QPC82303.1 transposase [Phototrophicus methaneseepsis]